MRGSQPWKTNRARVLRGNAVRAEAKLWWHLRNRQLGGFKFTRQAPIEGHFADFLCREQKLVVEVDGGTHSEPEELARDGMRTALFERLGYRVVRVSNDDVYRNIDGVLAGLLMHLEENGAS